MSRQLIILSGLSGSGKTTVLHTLEDLGYYCVDNIPASMLGDLAQQLKNSNHTRLAVSIDVRNSIKDFSGFKTIINELNQGDDYDVHVVFLDARIDSIVRRFKDTRRKHPLQTRDKSIEQAIALERQQLDDIIQAATLRLDTSSDNVHGLRERIQQIFDVKNSSTRLLVRLISFGFKNGAPPDADFVFDARHLPNPHWEAHLREYTGQSSQVREFFSDYPEVVEYQKDIERFLLKWAPKMNSGNRSYLTIAIGCTGGKHRSVYLIESIAKSLSRLTKDFVVHHRDCTACQ